MSWIRWCNFHFRISIMKNVIDKKTSPWKDIFYSMTSEPKLLTLGQIWSKNVTGEWRELHNVFLSDSSYHTFYHTIILLEIMRMLTKITILWKFKIWWYLVTSILTWPENDLRKTWRARRDLSNAIYRLSIFSVVSEIWRGSIRPPAPGNEPFWARQE